MLALLLLLSSAEAASLDLIEVGGMWGTPGATNPTAVWWNPAGLAAGAGTQVLIEGAPTFATVNFDRTNPSYGAPEGNPQWDFGGSEKVKFNGTVPFLGVSSDFGVKNLGVGLALAVPFARGGIEEPDGGPGQFHLREGNIQAIYAMAGAAWTFADKVSVGVSGAMVDSTWEARTQVETMKSLNDTVKASGFGNYYCTDDVDGPCQDYLFEDPGYSAELTFDPLKDRAFTFGAGVYVTPVDKVGISLAYSHGMRLEHTGEMHLKFGCPPDTDFLGLVGAQQAGLCDVGPDGAPVGADASGDGVIGYTLPSRINAGVVLQPVEKVRAEIMGGWVGWSAFTDYDIQTKVTQEQFEDELCNEDDANGDGTLGDCTDAHASVAAETAGLVSQTRQWARDNHDSFWFGVDAKLSVNRFVTLGARALYDHSAIPSSALSTNNFDAPAVTLGAMAVLTPIEQLGIGLSFGHQFLTTRTVEDSAFGVTMVETAQKEDRYFYPSANGVYSGGINRIGISVRGKFLAKKQM